MHVISCKDAASVTVKHLRCQCNRRLDESYTTCLFRDFATSIFFCLHLSQCLCTHTVVYVFLDAATLTEVFPCFFLSCKANSRV